MAPTQLPNKNDDSEKLTVYVNGLLSSIEFQKAKCCAEDLFKNNSNLFSKPVIKEMLEFEWATWLNLKKEEIKGDVWAFSDLVMVFVNKQMIGDTQRFLKWSSKNYNYEDFRNDILYETLRTEYCSKHITNTKNDFVYMDFTHDNNPIGRIVIQLFTEKVPKTCENFRLLCTGELGRSETNNLNLSYKNTIVHRIVQNGWIQGGDIQNGKGGTSESVFGGTFEDEAFNILHYKRGIVGMANMGRHTNGSQFYITLQPAKWMDKKFVAFGQVVEGSETLKKIEYINTQNERPLKECKIVDSGLFTYEY